MTAGLWTLVVVTAIFLSPGIIGAVVVALYRLGGCRFGIHTWGKWEAGGITNHYGDWSPTNIPYKRTRRMYRECTKCGIEKMRRVKV